MNRFRNCHLRLPATFISLSCIALTLLSPPLQAQGDPTALLERAQRSYEASNFKEAGQQFEEFATKFQDNPSRANALFYAGLSYYYAETYDKAEKFLRDALANEDLEKSLIQTGQLHLGLALHFQEQNDKALAPLRDAAANEENKEVAELASFYTGQVMFAEGNRLQAAGASPTGAFNKAIANFTTFIGKHPESAYFIDAMMTRGRLYALTKQYDKAAADMEQLGQKKEASGMEDEIDYLLGFIASQEALELLGEFKTEEAKPAIAKARAIYQKLLKNENLMIANDAAFQLANLDFVDKNYAEALKSFRAIRNKDALITSQQRRVDDIKNQISRSAGNQARVGVLSRLLKREQNKLTAIKQNPDSQMDALIRVGDCYAQLSKYDEARTIFRHLYQNTDDPEMQGTIQSKIIASQALQGLAEAANEAYNSFKQQNPNHPSLEVMKFLIGQSLLRQQRYEDAIQALEESRKEYPNSRVSDQIPRFLADAYLNLKQFDKAIEVYDRYINDAKSGKINAPAEAIDEAKRSKAVALFGNNKMDEGIAVMKELVDSTQNADIKRTGLFQLAEMQQSAKKIDEAVASYERVVAEMPDSEQASNAKVRLAAIFEAKGETDKAMAAYEEMLKTATKDQIKVYAFEKIWRSHEKKQEYDKVIEVQDRQLAAFPDSERALLIYFERGKLQEEKLRKYEDALASYAKLEPTYQNLSPDKQQSMQSKTYVAYGMVRAADIKYKMAGSLGSYASLDDAGKQKWAGFLSESEKLLKKAVEDYGDSNATAFALSKLVDLQANQIRANLIKPADAYSYYSETAGNLKDESVISQILLAQAALAFKMGNPKMALAFYGNAFERVSDPKKIRWQDYERYGDILIENNDFDTALKIGQQLKDAYPEPKHAQAAATFLIGAAYQGQNKLDQAGQFFTELQEKFPWSPKIVQAEYGRGLSLVASGKFEEGLTILDEIITKPNAKNRQRAKAMLEIGRGLLEMNKQGLESSLQTKNVKEGEKVEIKELAVSYFLKVDAFYDAAEPEIAAEALYEAIQTLMREGKTEEARKWGASMNEKYPASDWAAKAREILS